MTSSERQRMSRGEVASLKYGDVVEDCHGRAGIVIFVEEDGPDPPRISLRQGTHLVVRNWQDVWYFLAAPE